MEGNTLPTGSPAERHCQSAAQVPRATALVRKAGLGGDTDQGQAAEAAGMGGALGQKAI